nr:5-formyltetrahydrofolate cyclo-ligase [uncultured Rhodopila sp.]
MSGGPAGGEGPGGPPEQDVAVWRKALRAELIAGRLALPAAQRAAESGRITARLRPLLAGSADGLIGFYWPFRGEYDPRPLMRELHAAGAALALPVVIARSQPLVFRTWQPGTAMARGVWDIPVPAAGDPVEPDTLLVPLVGFDAEGYRLGYGGGFYDRTIAAMKTRPRTIGIGFACGRLSTIHPQPYDIRMDRIVTGEDG